MVFLYAELLVLLTFSFLAGAAATAALVRMVVRRTPGQVSAYVAEPGRRR